MRVVVPLLAFLISFAASGEEGKGPSSLAVRLDVPFITIPRLPEALSLERAPELTKWSAPLKFGLLSGETADVLPDSTGYLACDDKRLYVAIRNAAPLDGLPEKAQPLDGDVWRSDNVEVLLIPGLDDSQTYYQFAIDPAESLFDAKGIDKSWNSGAEVKVFREKESWTAVLAVDVAAVGVTMEKLPALWRINLHSCRVKRGNQTESDLSWSPTRSRSNHVPSRFGLALLNDPRAKLDLAAAQVWVEQKRGLSILLKQRFDTDVAPFTKAKPAKDACGTFMVSEGPSVTLERNFGDISGLRMAFAYRTPADVHGLTVQGSGTIARTTRPGMTEVFGHGLKVAQETCNDADHKTMAWDLGRDAFKFRRPYGH